MGRVDPEKRRAATARLRQLADAGHLTSRHVRLTAVGCGVSERTVWRWLDTNTPESDGRERPGYRLTDTDRAAYAFYRGNAATVHRARRGSWGISPLAGVAVSGFLTRDWQAVRPVADRTLRRTCADQVSPAETALLRLGENARRDADVWIGPR